MAPQARRGFSLVEMLVAVTLTLAVFAITLPFVRAQTRNMGRTATRLDVEQIARYAQRVIDRDLRRAIADPGQPLMVFAGPKSIAFNANLLARSTADPMAWEVNTSADTSITEAWRVTAAGKLPLSTTLYPTTTYLAADGLPSRNETVAYFLHPDTVSGRSDVYVLWRRINAAESTLVVRSVYVPTGTPFFTYYVSSADSLEAVASVSLPLLWSSSTAAQIRAVAVQVGGFARNARENRDAVQSVSWLIRIPNAGTTSSGSTCGSAPGAPASMWFNQVANSSGLGVEVFWTPSGDDGNGANDVTHYVVSKSNTIVTPVWRAIAHVSARRASQYRYVDFQPTDTGRVLYGVHAVDCGGSASGKTATNQWWTPDLPVP